MNTVADSPKGGSDVLLLPAWLIIAVALGLFAVQLLMGTDPAFASFVLLFVCLSGITVNVIGGLRTVSGILIGVCALKTVIASQILKIWYHQPAHTHLEAPNTTMLIMVVAMLGLLTIALTLRILPLPRRGVIRPVTNPSMLLTIGLVALAISIASFAIVRLGGDDAVGGIFGAAKIAFGPAFNLAVIAVTAHAIVSSGGCRSLNWAVAVVLAIETMLGLLTFSKQAVMEPLLAYYVTCFAFRYRFRWTQVVIALGFLVLAIQFIAPVITFVRDQNLSVSERVELIQKTVTDLFESDRLLKEEDYWAREYVEAIMMSPYYGEPKGLIDRYTLMHVDFVAHGVDSVGTLGWATVEHGFKMLLPRFMNPDKPTHPSQPLIRYHIDRRAAFAETQFSFPVWADGYVSFGYLGAYLFTVIFVGILLAELKILADRLTNNIWAVLFVVLLHHPFPEFNANMFMLAATHTMLILITFVYTVKWLAKYNPGFFKAFRRRRDLPAAAHLARLRAQSAGE